jgi:protease-4
MAKFFLGLALGLLLPALGLLIAPWCVQWWIDRPPRVASGTTLTLRLSGAVTEAVPGSWNPLDPPALTSFAIWDVLRKAAVDPRISALWLESDKPAAGWAKMGEIREALLAFRKSGKPAVSFLRTPNSRDFYLATATERISVQPSDFVDVKGLRVELLYARTALDKLGVVAEVEAIGRYKDGADIATRSTMSAETKEVIDAILDARYRELTSAIGSGRNRPVEQVKELLDNGPFLTAGAQRAGLIDAAEFSDQAESALAKKLGQSALKKVSAIEYQKVTASSLDLAGKHKIAILAAEGDIARRPIPYFAEEVLSPDEFGKVTRELRDDSSIKGVVVRVDSPGGDAIASEELLRHLKVLAEKKPVVVSMVDIAASGGYELAIGGHLIVAHPATLTGSIGVFYGKLNLQGLNQKLGLHREILTRGRFAAIDSDSRGLSNEERIKLRELIQQSYSHFVSQVAAARKRPYDEIDKVAQGRVWVGDQAKAAGLVDELGGLPRALELVKQRAGIAPTEKIAIEVYPRRPGVVESVERKLRPYAASGVSLPAGAVWKRIPWSLDVR